MGRLNPVERRVERFLREPPSVRNAAGVIVVATLVVVVGAGALMTLLDTVIGCAVALIATYLLWPRDREVHETVPAT